MARVEFENLPGEGVGDAHAFEDVVSEVPDGVVAGEGCGIPGFAHDGVRFSPAATSAAHLTASPTLPISVTTA